MPLPFPSLSNREKYLIGVLREHTSDLSYRDIADVLNECFPEDNGKCRTRYGIKKYLARIKPGLSRPYITE